MRFLFISVLFVGWLLVALTGCKELNDDYPPVLWSVVFENDAKIRPGPITALIYENDHRIWLGSQSDAGLICYNGRNWEFLEPGAGMPSIDSVTAIVRDGYGLLWVGWRSGLANYNGSVWQRIPQFDGRCVTSLAVEEVGNIWVGISGSTATGGLAYYKDRQWSFLSPANSGFSSSRVRSLAYDTFAGLWVCTADQGVISLQSGTMRQYKRPELTLDSDHFTSVAIDERGWVWTGNIASQLVCFQPNNIVSVVNTGAGSPVTSITTAENNILWVGTRDAGLIRFDGRRWQCLNVSNARLPSNTVIRTWNGNAGSLLFSLDNGQVLSIKSGL